MSMEQSGGKLTRAGEKDWETVKQITAATIREVYPRYYPRGAVEFFLSHHNGGAILKDIRAGLVFLVWDGANRPVGTVTVRANEICRLFVLPASQKQGFGRALLEFAENRIAERYETIVLDASLPAKALYWKIGYAVVEPREILTDSGDFLCFDVMRKTVR